MSAPDETLRDFHRRWATLRPPQRPPQTVVEAMRTLLAGREMALQLGVTPEIALLPARSVALDWNANMVALAWPGGGPERGAIVGDWKQLPLRDRSVDAVFSDGCFTMLRWPEEYRLVLGRLASVMRPGGRAVIRCFASPEPGETLDELCHAVWESRVASFPSFKMRLNMAIATSSGDMNPSSDRIHRIFSALFPDRERLAGATGWTQEDIGEIDHYRGSAFIHSYPVRAALLSVLPAGASGRFVETDGYELAERCPLLVLDFP